MKPSIVPTGRETVLSDDEIIISKTDTKGRITYGNAVLVRITGYQEDELLGKQHNIVRHPDMPRAIFKILWDRISAGEEFNGYVKNLRKDGGHYWVYTNVTPSYNSAEQLIGYYSVRRKARPEALSVIEPLYEKMLMAERDAGSKGAIPASLDLLNKMLAEKGVSYDKFICTL